MSSPQLFLLEGVCIELIPSEGRRIGNKDGNEVSSLACRSYRGVIAHCLTTSDTFFIFPLENIGVAYLFTSVPIASSTSWCPWKRRRGCDSTRRGHRWWRHGRALAALTDRFAEVRQVERAVGRAGVRMFPFHFWYDQLIASGGTPSPAFKAAAERARAYWDAVLPTLPTLK